MREVFSKRKLGKPGAHPDANYLTYTGEFPFEVEVIRI